VYCKTSSADLAVANLNEAVRDGMEQIEPRGSRDRKGITLLSKLILIVVLERNDRKSFRKIRLITKAC
jgi:hypothetical protein